MLRAGWVVLSRPFSFAALTTRARCSTMAAMRCATCHFDPCRCLDLEEGFHPASKSGKQGWPYLSDSMACHPEQIPEMVESFRKQGVSVEYKPDGRPIVRDAGHQRQMMRVLGYQDLGKRTNNAPKNRTMLEASRDNAPPQDTGRYERLMKRAFGIPDDAPLPRELARR